MKNHLSYWMKGKIWRFPLSLSLFLLPPAIYASEVQMEAVFDPTDGCFVK